MGDMSEDFHALRAVLKEQRAAKVARNLKGSRTLLEEHGVAFEVKNAGLHFIIRDRGRVFDFWPSTGKWRQRDNAIAPGSLAVHRQSLKSGRGVLPLLAAINEGKKTE